MAVRWKQVMTMLLKGVSQSGTARAAHCSKRDVSRAARVIRECSVDSALLASLSDREVAERWFPARPRERAGGGICIPISTRAWSARARIAGCR